MTDPAPSFLTPTRRGILWALLAISIWSGWIVTTRYGVKTPMTPLDLTMLRFGSAGLLLAPLLWRKGLGLTRANAKPWALLILGAGAPYIFVAANGFRFAPAAHGTMIPGSMPVFVVILGALVLGAGVPRQRLMGLSLVVAGVMLLIGTGLFAPGGGATAGHVLFLACSALWASYTLAAPRTGMDAWHITAVVTGVSAVLILPFFLLGGQSGIGQASLGDIAFQVFYQGLMTSIISLYASSRAIELIGPQRTSSFSPLVPVMASLIAIPVLGEIPSATDWAAILMISLGVMLAGRAGAGANKPA